MKQAACVEERSDLAKPLFFGLFLNGRAVAFHAAEAAMKKTFLTIALSAALLVTGAVAQAPEQPQEHQHDAAPGQMNGMGGMCGMMMSHMQGMMTGHADTAKIVADLQKNLAEIQADKKSGPLKEKLAAQAALLKDLQTKMDAQSHMMGMMNGMMPGMMHGGNGQMACCNMPAK